MPQYKKVHPPYLRYGTPRVWKQQSTFPQTLHIITKEANNDDIKGVITRYQIGIDNLIWGNDYPHHDSIWPHSQATLENMFQDVPEDEKRQMTRDNVIKLYGINVPEQSSVA